MYRGRGSREYLNYVGYQHVVRRHSACYTIGTFTPRHS